MAADSDLIIVSRSREAYSPYIDTRRAFRETPPQLDFVWPGFYAGTVGILVGSGGSGKSFLALELAMAVSGGQRADLLRLEPTSRGKVIYLCLEDPHAILLHRMHAVGQRFDEETQDAVADRFFARPAAGKLLDLLDSKHSAALMRECEGVRLLIIDTLRRAHSGDENSNSEMAKLLGVCERVCSRTGVSILLVHHTRKGGAGDGGEAQHAARGASALVDNARWGACLDRMSEHDAETHADQDRSTDPLLPLRIHERRGFYAKLSYPKPNYGEPRPDSWLRREKGGVLVPARLEYMPAAAKSGDGAARKRAEATWRGRPGRE